MPGLHAQPPPRAVTVTYTAPSNNHGQVRAVEARNGLPAEPGGYVWRSGPRAAWAVRAAAAALAKHGEA